MSWEQHLITQSYTTDNVRLLGNLRLVTDALLSSNELRPVQLNDEKDMAGLLRDSSALENPDKHIEINRSADELLLRHDTTTAQAQKFALGEVVLDLGCGMSDFLDTFSHESMTIAVDNDRWHADAQAQKGHKSYNALAHDMPFIQPGSVKLLHEAYAASFWGVSANEVQQLSNEIYRVLATGGIALLGPTMRNDDHAFYENRLRASRYGQTLTPIFSRNDAKLPQFVRASFASAVLDMWKSRKIALVGHRFSMEKRKGLPNTDPQDHLPNYLSYVKLT